MLRIMKAGLSAKFFRHSEDIGAVSSFIIQNDEGDGVPWWMILEKFVLSDKEHATERAEYRKLRELRKLGRIIYNDETAWEEIKRKRQKPFVSEDQLYRILRLGKDLGIFFQDHANAPYRVSEGGLATTIREREIYYLRNIPLKKVLMGDEMLTESIYGLSKSDLAPSEAEELNKIRARIQKLGEDLLKFQCRVLERRFAKYRHAVSRTSVPEGTRNRKGGDSYGLSRAKKQLHDEITDEITHRLKIAKNKQGLISVSNDLQSEFEIPIMAVVSPEVHTLLRHEIERTGRRHSAQSSS